MSKQKFLQTIKHLSSIKCEYPFAVQAIFANMDEPGNGMSAYIKSFKTMEEADQMAFELANKYSHEFITYRAVKMGNFHDFNSNENRMLLSDDEKLNQNLLSQKRKKNEIMKAEEKKRKILKSQMDEEDKLGTVENVTRLIYLCERLYRSKIEMEKKIGDIDKLYEDMKEKLYISIKTRPQVLEEWKDYADYLDEVSSDQLVDWLNNYVCMV